MARQSLEHTFLPGSSLWADRQATRRVRECAATPGMVPAAACRKFLEANEKASYQWQLEREFDNFEKRF
jgi:adenosine deaminase